MQLPIAGVNSASEYPSKPAITLANGIAFVTMLTNGFCFIVIVIIHTAEPYLKGTSTILACKIYYFLRTLWEATAVPKILNTSNYSYQCI